MSNGQVRLTIPRHNPVNAFTMGSIVADAGLTPDELKSFIESDDALYTATGHHTSIGPAGGRK